MNIFPRFSLLLLAGIADLASSAPLSEEILTVDQEFYPDAIAIYTSQHDIVNLFCPLNSLNFDDSSPIEQLDGTGVYTFFIEADVTDGEYEYKGLYVLKNEKATKLLENGRDFAATSDNSKQVFLAATDGIYLYNPDENKADKYGTLSDSFIGVAITNGSEYLYVLTEDHVVYKVSNGGTEKEILPEVKDAVQILLDYSENLFFLDTKNDVYVRKVDGAVTKVKGLPNAPSFAKLIRPPIVFDDGVPFVAGKKVFELSVNGSSEFANIILKNRPSAYSPEATLLQYYAYEKKIYKYSFMSILGGILSDLDELKKIVEGKSDDITSIKSKFNRNK